MESKLNNAVETVRTRFVEFADSPAVWKNDKFVSYSELNRRIDSWLETLSNLKIESGSIVGILGDFSPEIAAIFFALMERRCILVPLTRDLKNIDELKRIANVEFLFEFDSQDQYRFEKIETDSPKNSLIEKFYERDHAGLIIFSSGSTGKPKGILQDCELVMRKFVAVRKSHRTILFLMMDHFGGFNTFLSALAYGGLAVCIDERSPEKICKAIESTQADLLPTTPTFLNLLIASRCYERYDLSSLRLITYGTEMMNQTTLERLKKIFPQVELKQTYGLSELGVLRSKSKNDQSLFLKVGGSEFQTKIINNILWIKAESNMVGYLNAENPFDEDGWFCTGDEVEQDGEYIRFVGRESDIINVGGQKVFPAEVEAVILRDENVVEAAVYGKKHPIMGSIVAAKITLNQPENIKDVSTRIRKLCSENLEKYKIPVKIEIATSEQQHNERFKKIR